MARNASATVGSCQGWPCSKLVIVTSLPATRSTWKVESVRH